MKFLNTLSALSALITIVCLLFFSGSIDLVHAVDGNPVLVPVAVDQIDASADVQTMLGSANNTVIISNIGAESDLVNKAGLYAALADASHFYELGDNVTIYYGTTPPTTCSAGQLFCDTDEDTDGSLLLCVSTNTWKDIGMGPDKDKIVEGDSNVEVIDTGTGQVDIDIDGQLKTRINGTGLDVNGTITADGYNVDATASPRVRALDSDCPGTDKFAGSIDWLYDKGADGAEYSSTYFRTMENGSNITQMHYDGNDTRWEIASGKGLVATGPIMGAINVSAKSDGNYTVGTDDAFESYGTMFINSDNDVITFYLPSAVKGMWACFENGQGVNAILTIDAAAGDYLVLEGTRTAAGDAVASTGALGDGCCVYAIDGTDWHVKGPAGTWGMP